MKIYVKMLQGQGAERLFEVDESATGTHLKEKVAKDLNVSAESQRLVFKGKPLSDEVVLKAAGISDGARIHLMVKKTDSKASTMKDVKQNTVKQPDLFLQLDNLLRSHLTSEQSTKVVSEFKKNCQLLIDSMNFEDIERFAASNFTEF